MSGLPGEVLNGEVCRVTVEVVNCGQVPLNSLRLTSSAGRRLLLDPVSPKIGLTMYITHCIFMLLHHYYIHVHVHILTLSTVSKDKTKKCLSSAYVHKIGCENPYM